MKNTKKIVVASVLLALLPIIFLFGYLYNNSINTPFWDQWELVPIFEHVNEGDYRFSDFWQQHNEHRLFIPRIVMVTSALMSNWNIRHEVLLSVVIAAISFLILLLMLYKIFKENKDAVPFVTPLVLSLLWFSLTQQENWLWGWQLQWFLSALGVVSALYGLTFIEKRSIPIKYLILVILSSMFAQYSLGNGVLIWPIVILGFVFLKVDRIKTGLLIAAGLMSTALYYIGYHSPPSPGSKTYLLFQPIEVLKYIFSYIGRPLSYDHILAPILGILITTVFLGSLYYLYTKQKKRLLQLLPMIGLGLYSLGSAAITAISRINLGLDQAYTSRYTTISTLLIISTLVIAVYNRDLLLSNLKKDYYSPIVGTVFVIFVLLLGVNYQHGKVAADNQIQYLKDIKGCTSQIDPYEACLLSTYPDKGKVVQRLEYLKQVHWGGY